VGSHTGFSTRSDEWSFADCLGILHRRRVSLAAITCLGIVAAAVVTVIQPHTYQAHAFLEFQPVNEAFLDLRDIYPAAAPSADAAVSLQTQTELLRQDALLESVARELGLDRLPEYQTPQGLVAKLKQDIRIEPVHNTRIIEIIAEARSAPLAARIANTLAATFIGDNIRERQEAAWQTYQALLPQLQDLRRALGPAAESARTAPAPTGTEVSRRVYADLLQKADQARLASSLRLTNIRLVNPAAPPPIPAKPNLPLSLAIGAVGGMLLAVAAVMLQEQQRQVLRAPGDAGMFLDLPELGAIPQAHNGSLPVTFLAAAGDGGLHLESASMEPSAGLSESFRATVMSILSAGRGGRQSRVLLVTSSQPMEGKTTVVSNLGVALAAISGKVLLIDGDMRRPRLHKLFGEANSWGLSDVLREKNAIDELPLEVLAKKTQVPNLYLLPSGASTDNIFGLLHSGRMSRLLPRFREEYDYILVDAPPCLEFADARIMARYAEELLLVVRANHTDRRLVQTAVERLRLDGLPLMGIILNRWDAEPHDPDSLRRFLSLGRQSIS